LVLKQDIFSTKAHSIWSLLPDRPSCYKQVHLAELRTKGIVSLDEFDEQSDADHECAEVQQHDEPLMQV